MTLIFQKGFAGQGEQELVSYSEFPGIHFSGLGIRASSSQKAAILLYERTIISG